MPKLPDRFPVNLFYAEPQISASILEIVSLVVAFVALTVTIVGFLAAVWFYTAGVKLQNAAQAVLVQVSERAGLIQTQVGDLFEKTLDAAIGVSALDESYDELDQQISNSGSALADGAPQGSDADWQQLVEAQLRPIRAQLDEYHELAEAIARGGAEIHRPQSQLQADILEALDRGSTSLGEIAKRVGMSRAAVRQALGRLQRRGLVQTETRSDGGYVYVRSN